MPTSPPFPSPPIEASPAVLQARGLYLSFDGRTVLDGIDLDIRSGCVILLRGENGSGKTCLVDILTGLLEPSRGVIHLRHRSGERVFKYPCAPWRRMMNLRHASPESFVKCGVSRSWQEMRLFESLTIGDNLSVAHARPTADSLWRMIVSPRRVRGYEKQATERGRQICDSVGLQLPLAVPSSSTSAGQARKLTIARALMSDPGILFLDEPLAGLDADGAREVIEVIRRLASTTGIAIVIVEHTLNVPRLLNLATEVWTIRDRRLVVESAATIQSEHAVSAQQEFPPWVRWVAQPGASVSTTQLIKGAALHAIGGHSAPTGLPVLQLENLVVRRGSHLVIGRDVANDAPAPGLSLAVQKGQLTVLTAPNGWGKTTLVEAVAGIIPIDRGRALVAGIDLRHTSTWSRVRQGLTVLRSGDNVFPGLTVEQTLHLAGVSAPALVPEHLLKRRMNTLSGGEKQLVAIDAALGSERQTSVAILDEPFQGLDDAALRRVCSYLADLLPTRGILITMPALFGARAGASDQEGTCRHS